MSRQIEISLLVEGIVDELVVRKIVGEIGGYSIGPVYKYSQPIFRKKVQAYNNAARHFPWLAVMDMDRFNGCPGDLARAVLSTPAKNMVFRIAVHEIESWIMADAKALSDFLKIDKRQVPDDTDSIEDAKQSLIGLARKSSSSIIREKLVPRQGSTSSVGSGYTACITELMEEHWSLSRSIRECRSASLNSAYRRLELFRKNFQSR